jgi:zinc transporter, ZIP family
MRMIYIAVAVDLFGDGLMIGAGSAVATSLALGQVLADVPDGFATIANLKDKDIPRRQRLILGASFAIPVLLAATLAYVLLRGQDEALQMAGARVNRGSADGGRRRGYDRRGA